MVIAWLWMSGCTPVVEDADRRMLGYQERFGMCSGFCDHAVQFSGRQVTFASVGSEGTLENVGSLTDDGRRTLQELVLADDEVLEDVYGCPGCDDGAEAVLTIGTADGGFSEHGFEGGSPPEVLEDMASFGEEALGAMRDCSSTPRVEIEGACSAVP